MGEPTAGPALAILNQLIQLGRQGVQRTLGGIPLVRQPTGPIQVSPTGQVSAPTRTAVSVADVLLAMSPEGSGDLLLSTLPMGAVMGPVAKGAAKHPIIGKAVSKFFKGAKRLPDNELLKLSNDLAPRAVRTPSGKILTPTAQGEDEHFVLLMKSLGVDVSNRDAMLRYMRSTRGHTMERGYFKSPKGRTLGEYGRLVDGHFLRESTPEEDLLADAFLEIENAAFGLSR